MVTPLDTDVKGSPPSCRDCANWLTRFADATHKAADLIAQAHHSSDASWHGPAGDAFRDSINGVDTDLDTTVTAMIKTANKLLDFASALDGVGRTMSQARDAASKGGLTVYGTLIIPPTAPGPQPQLGPMAEMLPKPGASQDPQVKTVIQQYKQAMNTYTQQVNTYNAQVEVFNHCADLVDDARKKEANAHHELQQGMTEVENDETDLVKIGKTVTEAYMESIIGTHEGAEKLEAQADKLKKNAAQFRELAEGDLSDMTQEDVDQLKKWAGELDTLSKESGETAESLQKWIKVFPASVLRALAKNPGRLLEDPGLFKAAKPILAHMPYSGAALNVAYAGYQVIFEHKPVGEALTEAGIDIPASAAGGAAGEAGGGWLAKTLSGFGDGFEDTAFLGTEEPGLGNLVTGTLGGVVGAVAGPEVVNKITDFFTGDQPTSTTFTKAEPMMLKADQPHWDPKVPRTR